MEYIGGLYFICITSALFFLVWDGYTDIKLVNFVAIILCGLGLWIQPMIPTWFKYSPPDTKQTNIIRLHYLIHAWLFLIVEICMCFDK